MFPFSGLITMSVRLWPCNSSAALQDPNLSRLSLHPFRIHRCRKQSNLSVVSEFCDHRSECHLPRKVFQTTCPALADSSSEIYHWLLLSTTVIASNGYGHAVCRTSSNFKCQNAESRSTFVKYRIFYSSGKMSSKSGIARYSGLGGLSNGLGSIKMP